MPGTLLSSVIGIALCLLCGRPLIEGVISPEAGLFYRCSFPAVWGDSMTLKLPPGCARRQYLNSQFRMWVEGANATRLEVQGATKRGEMGSLDRRGASHRHSSGVYILCIGIRVEGRAWYRKDRRKLERSCRGRWTC
jgi:hypothetical protein